MPYDKKPPRAASFAARSAESDGMIEGRNAVIEALRAGTPIDKIYLARGETDKTLGHIASTARAAEAMWPRVLSVSPRAR